MCISLEMRRDCNGKIIPSSCRTQWSGVMSRGQDERSPMHAMSLLLNKCEGMTNRVLIDDGARWILQGSEQEKREPDSRCDSSLQYAGVDNFWPC